MKDQEKRGNDGEGVRLQGRNDDEWISSMHGSESLLTDWREDKSGEGDGRPTSRRVAPIRIEPAETRGPAVSSSRLIPLYLSISQIGSHSRLDSVHPPLDTWIPRTRVSLVPLGQACHFSSPPFPPFLSLSLNPTRAHTRSRYSALGHE